MIVICDIETEKLDNPQHIWLIVCKEVDTGAVHVFRSPTDSPEEAARFSRFARLVSCWCGHNFLAFDVVHLRSLLSVEIADESILDTLVVSRLLNTNIQGGHSLEAWGERLGSHKISFNDFSKYSLEMEHYCLQDVEVNYLLYQKFKPYLDSKVWASPISLEHKAAIICREMHTSGFFFEKKEAEDLYKNISIEVSELEAQLQKAFPPRSRLLREITPKATKHGTLHRQDFRWLEDGDLSRFGVGATFSLVEFVPFNPRSPKQVVERLNEAGWKPIVKTDGYIQAERAYRQASKTGKPTTTKKGVTPRTAQEWQERLKEYETTGWSICEENLATLPENAPEAAKGLAKYLVLSNRHSVLTEWFEAYDATTGRIHGNFNHIGAWTHRMSHSGPNMANIPSGDSLYAHEMRSLWSVPKDKLLVGVDADGIQLRILAHYMDDKAFTEALINGDKSLGTDAHTVNKNILGNVCKDRDTAKTFIYAWVLGAALAKVAEILGCSISQASDANEAFLEAYPGLENLKRNQIPYDAKRGYFIGLDGRYVLCDSEHLMLAGYLQNGEQVIMKKANTLWRSRLLREGVPFTQVNFVHDEWQTEVPNDMELAKYVAEVQAESIRVAGEQLNLKCPMAGSIIGGNKQLAIGRNWAETH